MRSTNNNPKKWPPKPLERLKYSLMGLGLIIILTLFAMKLSGVPGDYRPEVLLFMTFSWWLAVVFGVFEYPKRSEYYLMVSFTLFRGPILAAILTWGFGFHLAFAVIWTSVLMICYCLLDVAFGYVGKTRKELYEKPKPKFPDDDDFIF
jgi:CDP-diglyceride synthetase